MTDNTAMHTSS